MNLDLSHGSAVLRDENVAIEWCNVECISIPLFRRSYIEIKNIKQKLEVITEHLETNHGLSRVFYFYGKCTNIPKNVMYCSWKKTLYQNELKFGKSCVSSVSAFPFDAEESVSGTNELLVLQLECVWDVPLTAICTMVKNNNNRTEFAANEKYAF